MLSKFWYSKRFLKSARTNKKMVQVTEATKPSKKDNKNKHGAANDKEAAEEENARMYAAIAFAFILIVVSILTT